MTPLIAPREIVFSRKNAQSLVSSIPEGAHIIIIPSIETTAWFDEGDDDIVKTIKTLRKSGHDSVTRGDYRSLLTV